VSTRRKRLLEQLPGVYGGVRNVASARDGRYLNVTFGVILAEASRAPRLARPNVVVSVIVRLRNVLRNRAGRRQGCDGANTPHSHRAAAHACCGQAAAPGCAGRRGAVPSHHLEAQP
jgi:hypothetical protein